MAFMLQTFRTGTYTSIYYQYNDSIRITWKPKIDSRNRFREEIEIKHPTISGLSWKLALFSNDEYFDFWIEQSKRYRDSKFKIKINYSDDLEPIDFESTSGSVGESLGVAFIRERDVYIFDIRYLVSDQPDNFYLDQHKKRVQYLKDNAPADDQELIELLSIDEKEFQEKKFFLSNISSKIKEQIVADSIIDGIEMIDSPFTGYNIKQWLQNVKVERLADENTNLEDLCDLFMISDFYRTDAISQHSLDLIKIALTPENLSQVVSHDIIKDKGQTSAKVISDAISEITNSLPEDQRIRLQAGSDYSTFIHSDRPLTEEEKLRILMAFNHL